jgi:DNA primase large subunit
LGARALCPPAINKTAAAQNSSCPPSPPRPPPPPSVLNAIENLLASGKTPDVVEEEILKHESQKKLDVEKNQEYYRRDLVSHHVLRLAFCAKEEDRRKFVSTETVLFKARLRKLNSRQVRSAHIRARQSIA